MQALPGVINKILQITLNFKKNIFKSIQKELLLNLIVKQFRIKIIIILLLIIIIIIRGNYLKKIIKMQAI